MFRNRIGEHGDSEAVDFEARKIARTARVTNADAVERAHCRCATFFTKVARMIVCETQHVESRCPVMLCVPRRRPEQIAGTRIFAFLRRFTAIDKHSLKVTEGDVGGGQDGRNAGEKTYAIVIRQVVLGKVSTNHHVTDGRDRDTKFAHIWRRRRFRS